MDTIHYFGCFWHGMCYKSNEQKGVKIHSDLNSVNEKHRQSNPSTIFINEGGMDMLKKRNQKGFTLIEIIAVLVILGILAAVAVPKYFDMQTEAKNKAAVAAIAQARGMLSMAWGKAALALGSSPAMSNVVAQMPTFSASAGEFSLAYATGVAGATITGSGTVGGASGGSATATWPLP